jgi:hypothetical protein
LCSFYSHHLSFKSPRDSRSSFQTRLLVSTLATLHCSHPSTLHPPHDTWLLGCYNTHIHVGYPLPHTLLKLLHGLFSLSQQETSLYEHTIFIICTYMQIVNIYTYFFLASQLHFLKSLIHSNETVSIPSRANRIAMRTLITIIFY